MVQVVKTLSLFLQAMSVMKVWREYPVKRESLLLPAIPILQLLEILQRILAHSIKGKAPLLPEILIPPALGDSAAHPGSLNQRGGTAHKIGFQRIDDQHLDRVNILFVIDNSASMEEERRSIADQFDSFLKDLVGFDYQIAIITTDVENNQGGKFILFSNGELFLSTIRGSQSLNEANAKVFKETIKKHFQNTHNTGASDEQGIAALNMALDSRNQVAFFRPHSLLMIIIISDEDENSDGSQLQAVNQPESFFNKVGQLYPYSSVVVHSIVYQSGDSGCPICASSTARCHVRHEGRTYIRASHPDQSIISGYGNVIQGHVSSICAKEYGSQLGSIARHAIAHRIFPLPCHPVPNSVSVQVNGSVTHNFKITGRKVFITGNFSFGAKTALSFRCLVQK